MMKLSKIFLIALAVATLVLVSHFLNAQALSVASTAPNLDTVAITFVNLMEEGQFEAASELFNTEMAEALPPQKLEATWNSLIGNVGEFKEIVETRTTEEKGYRVVYVTCEFAKASLDIKVVFDEEAQIAGLWFVAAATEGIHGIYIAAFIVTGISVVLWGGLVYWLSKRKWKYLALMLITLPFSIIVNLLMKKPVYDFLVSSVSVSSELSITTPWWLLLFVLFLSPITEEAVKLSPLLARQVRRMIDRSSALWIGMALGIGFGVGEIWYLAWQFSMVPDFAGYPFYYFGGFITERLTVVFIHGVITAVAVTGFLKGIKGLLMGYVGAVFLHALTNIGATLYQIKLWDATFASIYLFLPIIVAFFIFEHLRKKQLKDKKPEETVLYTRD
jgi:hypothetical protein